MIIRRIYGWTEITESNGRLAYSKQVQSGNVIVKPNGCGADGRKVVFRIGDWIMDHNRPWGNS